MKRAILEIIASDVATTRCELEDFVKCTMYYYEHKFEIKYFDQILLEYKQRMQSKTKPTPDTDNDDQDLDFVGNCMRFLGRYEFIRLQYNEELQEIKYVSTRLGYACLSSSMPPSDGFFRKYNYCFVYAIIYFHLNHCFFFQFFLSYKEHVKVLC